ncbi:MAG: hypothetical protein HZC24_14315 [Rhodocyclales bacterium]|nr:hypothetical protein [Rhodocyclales bacterium]
MTNDEMVAQITALGGMGILILIVVLIVLVLPLFLVMFSKRIHGGRKLLWVVLMGTFSWLAWPPYAMMLRKAEKEAGPEPGKT